MKWRHPIEIWDLKGTTSHVLSYDMNRKLAIAVFLHPINHIPTPKISCKFIMYLATNQRPVSMNLQCNKIQFIDYCNMQWIYKILLLHIALTFHNYQHLQKNLTIHLSSSSFKMCIKNWNFKVDQLRLQLCQNHNVQQVHTYLKRQ